MDIGVGLPNQVANVDPTVIPRWAARAEKLGFHTLGSIGRITYPGVMDTVALAAAAGATERIQLMTGILVATAWPARILAKEVAGIDGISGGRLTLGIAVGGQPRPDDFTVDALPPRGLGPRIERDVETYRDVWDGRTAPDALNPMVPTGTRRVPLLYGGFAPAAFRRAARTGIGYIGASVAPSIVAGTFATARQVWTDEGRSGEPHLVAIGYSAMSDPDSGRTDVAHYYSPYGNQGRAITDAVSTTPTRLRDAAAAYRDLGADRFVVNPAVASLEELERIAEVLL